MFETSAKQNKSMSRFEQIDFNNLGFGKYFGDHVYESEYVDGVWHEGIVKKYQAMSIDPGMSTLHYGQTIFEGLKAYKDFKNGGFNIFRPDMNAKRLSNSAERICMPRFDQERFIEAVDLLVRKDEKFVPQKEGQSLYIRPILFGDGNFLGVHPSDTYKFLVMCSPVASYYQEGLKPVRILVEDEMARTVRGGLGRAKTAANYAASLYSGRKAKSLGFAQVLWLDGVHLEYVDEVGAMNIMFMIDDVLVTPSLDRGTILPGVTRDTVIQLAKDFGMPVEERDIKISEVIEAHEAGKLQEVFGTGTAAIISPVGELNFKGKAHTINNMEIGPVAQKFYDTIIGLVHGTVEDKHGWNHHIDI